MTEPLTNIEVEALMRGGENEAVEFKSEDVFQTELAEVLMSQANSGHASYLLIGIDDQPVQIRGVKNVKGAIDKLVNAARQVVPSLIPYITITEQRVGDRIVVVARLPANLPGIYHVAGKYLRRRGTQRIPMMPEELVPLIAQRNTFYDSQPVAGATLADISWEQVDRYLELRERHRSSRIPRTVDRVELLQKLSVLTRDNTPTVAGILCFGRDPQHFFPFHVIKAARFKDTTTRSFLDQAIIGGTLPDMIETTVTFVQRNTRHGARITSIQRVDEDEYPPEAVRETLANACMHRDYLLSDASIRCHIFTNRIEIDNPGGLLPGVTVETLPMTNKQRNPKIAELLYHTGYAETQGTGIRRVLAAMHQAGRAAPNYYNLGYSLFVTLPGPEATSQTTTSTSVIQGSAQAASPSVLPLNEVPLVGLNRRQREFLVMLANTGRMTREDYERIFTISARTAKSDLKILQDRGFIERSGSGRASYYVLAQER